jgi:hypothetical protein
LDRMRGRHTRTRRLQGRAPATEPTLNQLNFCGPHALEKTKEAVGRTRIWQYNAGEHGHVLPVGSMDRSLGATGCQIGFAHPHSPSRSHHWRLVSAWYIRKEKGKKKKNWTACADATQGPAGCRVVHQQPNQL